MTTTHSSPALDAGAACPLPLSLSQAKRDVLEILLAAQRRGVRDMTASELQKAYESQVTHKRVRDGWFAGRVSEMVRDGYLLRSAKRQCQATLSPLVNTVYAPSSPAGSQTAGRVTADIRSDT